MRGSGGVSVVMGTYNGERFLEAQLESILAQTITPDEIVVGDDNSSDGTVAILEKVAKRSVMPIRIARNPRTLGFADNFLAAARRATGRYVAFSDQDDLWRPHKLERQLELLRRHDAVLCAHAVNHVDPRGTVLSHREEGEATVITPEETTPWGNFYGFTMLFPRSLLDRLPAELRGSDPHSPGKILSHDRWVYFLASISGPMVVAGEGLADYRQHEGQLYGGTKARTIGKRIADKRELGDATAQTMIEIARSRTILLAALDDPVARSAQARWRSWRDALVVSAEVYGSAGPARRGRALLSGIVRGGYRSTSRGGLGRTRFQHDLVMAAVPRAATKADMLG